MPDRERAHGREQHHPLDPRTGHPAATEVLPAVAAPTCQQTGVVVKTALILGADGAAFLEDRGPRGLVCTAKASAAVGGRPGRAQGSP
jgi:thiamine biosynthesis lipoprotein ApbE